MSAPATCDIAGGVGPRYRPYPEYRESGAPALGVVPAHWQSKRLRFCALVNPVKSEIRSLAGTTEVSFVPMEAVHEFGGLSLDATRLLDDVLTGYTYFRDGDIVVAKITPCFENGKGSIAESLLNGIGFGTTELHVIRPGPELDRRFMFFLTLSDPFRKLGAAEMYGAGGQKRVPDSFIRDFIAPLPPLPEQRAIAAFLDHQTRQIDELIAKKRRLIELLAEKRSALISHAVTKGLNPSAPMKPSGIDWLGDVPAHWEVKPLKHVVSRIGSGKTPKGGAEVYVSEGVMLLRSQNVYDDGLRLDDVVFIDEDTDAEMAGTRVQANDVLLNITGASIGRCAIVLNDMPAANVNQHVCIIRPAAISAAFLHAFLCSKAVKDWVRAEENGTSREGLNFRQVASIALPVPLSDEQQAIMAVIARQNERIDAMHRATEDAISRLCEYRQALISAAVTGKIDVREEA